MKKRLNHKLGNGSQRLKQKQSKLQSQLNRIFSKFKKLLAPIIRSFQFIISKFNRRPLTIVLAVLFMFSLALPLYYGKSVSAFNLYSQSSWSGGVGTDPQTQYAAINNLNAGNDLSLGNTTNTWCSTANCTSSWTKRKSVYIQNPTNDAYTDTVVKLTVPYQPSMKTDFSDLRFVATNNATELGHYLQSKTDTVTATVFVKVNSIPANSKATINMYYGNAGAVTTSDSAIMNFVDDFEKYSTTTELITEWGTYGTNENQLTYPGGIDTDSSGNVYVADFTNLRVMKYDSNGNFIFTFGYGVDDGTSAPQVCTSGCGSGISSTADGAFASPTAVAIDDATQEIYVLDQSLAKVQIFNSAGVFQRKFGSVGSGNWQMQNPWDITVRDGNYFITDTDNDRIVYGPTSLVAQYSSGSLGSGQGELDSPKGITDFSYGGYSCVLAIADTGNNRIIQSGCDVSMIDIFGNGAADKIGSAGWEIGKLNGPTDVAVDSNANYYVSDRGNNRIQKFNIRGQHLGTWAAVSNYITINSAGKIYSTNSDGSKVQKFEPPSFGPGVRTVYVQQTESYYFNREEIIVSGNPIVSNETFNRSRDRVYEYDFKVDLSTANCNEYDQIIVSSVRFSSELCDDAGKFIKIDDIVYDGIVAAAPSDFNGTNPDYRIREGQYIRVMRIDLASGGSKHYISYDGSDNLIEMSWAPTGSSVADTSLVIYAGNVTFKNLSGYNGLSFNPSIVYGIEEYVGGKVGSVESAVFDAASIYTNFGTITANSTGNGNIGLYVRGSDSLSFTQDYYFCGLLNSGANTLDSSCLTAGKRYVQYMMVLSEDNGENLVVDSVDIQYLADTGPPDVNASDIVIKKSPSGATVSDGAWINTASPYFSWTAGQDTAGGLGLAGYCVYLGTDSNADPVTTSGILPTNSNQNYNGIDVNNACDYATDQTSLDITSFINNVPITDGETYYLKIKAIDTAGLIFAGQAESTSFRVDISSPNQPQTVFSAPSGFINSKEFNVDWAYVDGVSFTDNHSGIAGIKYCVTSFVSGAGGCTPGDTNWFGKQHTSGSIDDISDVFPVSDSTLRTVPADADRLDDAILGANFVGVVVVDNAGNYTFGSVTNAGVVLITNQSASAPQNLAATPVSNVANEFSFTWDAPAVYSGPESIIDYCWTVNDPIEADGSNCNWTGPGITQLANGPFATIQGTNTLYMIARDQSGNINNGNLATVTFTASTTAPGPPQDTEISDVSTKATSTWKLALSWSVPDQVGAGVSSYKIFRSTSENGTFTQVGSTSPSNLSFIDSGLAQTDYYYHVKACDSANSCSVAGNVVTKKPTGRFTTPASLTADTNQPKVTDIGTKKATITWGTNRESDSKVAFGTKPGTYNPSEIGNSTQTTDHSVSLTNLQPGTTYYYVARWTDEDGNTGASQERSFRTLDAPVVKNVTSNNITVRSGDISVTVQNTSSLKLLYGKDEGFGESKTLDTSAAESKYDINLLGLDDGQKYFYKFVLVDATDNEYQSDVYSFTTLPLPRITNLRFQPVEGSPSSTQKVSWTTNVPATSSISYGPVGQKPLESLKSDLVTEHEITISGLTDNTDYNFVARSTDAAGNTATSDSQTFKTALDTRPPKISDVSIETTIRGTGSEAKGQVIVSWKTDEKATSQVAYGLGQTTRLTSSTKADDKLTTDHVVVLSDLSTSSIYSVQPVSLDKGDNESKGEIQSAIIGRPSDNVFSIIYNALRSIFGIDG